MKFWRCDDAYNPTRLQKPASGLLAATISLARRSAVREGAPQRESRGDFTGYELAVWTDPRHVVPSHPASAAERVKQHRGLQCPSTVPDKSVTGAGLHAAIVLPFGPEVGAVCGKAGRTVLVQGG